MNFFQHLSRIAYHFRLMVAALRLRSLLLKVKGHQDYLARGPQDHAQVARVRRSLLWCRDRVAGLSDTVADVRDPSLVLIDEVVADAEQLLARLA